MARIVSGIATSHTPLLTLGAAQWIHRANIDYENPKLNLSDGRLIPYADLLAEVGPRYAGEIDVASLSLKEQACNAELDKLAAALAEANPDAVVIIGDDQAELFNGANQPAFAIYHGAIAHTIDKLQDPATPDWLRTVRRGYMLDRVHELKCAPELALQLITGLIDEDIDVAACDRVENPLKQGFGHAYGFVVKRLFGDRQIPIVPVLLNTYFGPNVPSARRCHDIGRAIRRVVESWPDDLRVTVVASGGLSHFVVDEPLDRKILAALENRDADFLRNLPRGALNSGSSEILNWVTAAGALEGLQVRSCEYLPLRRTPAGTGVGAGFVTWF
ncbi:extradiol ring-cleavage dioxygenase [Paraburkholderia sp. CNPSo 3157]|uniref:Extradiol ring-cleavage dioxygenase n=1 Tax=Paraburkholderia franconis TaxID=2654983 RepID=A0A7X1NHY8_9BURK|nr:extradiol ring-cleavage dioxygenase [Paraburkholderia franconis]MPW22338.1 extradiol ring-cleavage dioxygenase [Paraburkholderia franconis]